MYQGILFILKNRSDDVVTDVFDSIPYEFRAGEEVSLPKDVAQWMLNRHPGVLELVGESHGKTKEPSDREVQVVNTGREDITEVWDDVEYGFEPNKPLAVDANVADRWVKKHDELEIVGADSAVQKPEEATAAEDAQESEPPDEPPEEVSEPEAQEDVEPPEDPEEPEQPQESGLPADATEDALACAECGKEYKTERGLNNHMTTHE